MLPGDTIVRRFRIERKVGAGGMGTVFRARDLEQDQPVAVKQLDIRAKNDAERFQREAAVLAELRHPGIVRYVSHGLSENNEHYIAMEWLEGKTLADRIGEGRLTVVETVQLGIRVASALHEAHERGVVHRDIKPPNLFLVGGEIGRVKVLDFGVARVSGGATGPTMTRTGALIGTPGYMAPEQARGAKELDARADIFALGSVLFECLTGQPPFTGTNIMAVLAKILLHEAPRVTELRPDAPTSLDDLIAKMLSKEPDGRPADVRTVQQALAGLTLGEIDLSSGQTRRPSQEEPPTKPPSLTSNEQRFLCVVLAGEMEGTAATLAAGASDELEAELSKMVSSLGGVWDPLVDGSTLIHFTDSGAATDLAGQAARCALQIRRSFGDVPVVLATGRGIVSGRLPFGEVIDRGARTLHHASADFVRLDGVSAALLETNFDVGLDNAGYFLRGERGGRASGRSLLGKNTPCVGRDRELITLEATYTECIQEPVARAVLVTAPPGLGKSRLRGELLKKIADRGEEVTVLEARGESFLAGSPFGLLGSAIKQAAGISDGEPLPIAQDKLRIRLERAVPEAERRRVLVFLAELAGLPFDNSAHETLGPARSDPVLMGDNLRSAFEDWLLAETALQPVILIFENLHAGDPPSVRFVDLALKRMVDRPLLVLGLARPEVHRTFPGLWRDREVQELKLGALTKKAAERLVQVVLPKLAPGTVQQVVERAEGNPFFLEELIRAVAENVGSGLPDSVVGMIQSRLDALGPEAKRVLRAASVFGDTFWRGGVVALLGGGDSTTRVSEMLDDLVDREVIARASAPTLPDQVEYRFRSSSVREAAYAMLTDHDRALGHRLAGEWLDQVGKRDVMVLAQHFERGHVPERAVAFYVRAAEQALGGNDLSSVAEIVDRGLLCQPESEPRGLLHLYRAQAHYWLGQVEATVEHAEAASRLLAQGTSAWYRAIADLLTSLGRLAQSELLRTWVDRAVTAQPAPEAQDARVICLARTAELLLVLGETELSDTLAIEVERAVDDHPQLSPLARARVERGRARRALHDGDPGAYATGLKSAISLFADAGDRRNATNERMSLGFALAELGDYAAAEPALVEARAAAVEMDLAQTVAYADHNLANVLACSGQLARAKEAAERAIAAGQAQRDPRLEGLTRVYLSSILLLSKDELAAKSEASTALSLLAELAAPRAAALTALARAELALGHQGPALDAAAEAYRVLEQLGGLEEGEAGARLVYAEALNVTGDFDHAQRVVATARDRLYQRAMRIGQPAWRLSFLEYVPDHARTLAKVAEWGLDTAPTLRD